MRQVLVENENFRISVEFCRGMPLLHLGIFHFSKSIYKQGRALWPGLIERLREAGHRYVYATPFEADIRAKRLISHFGFELRQTKHGVHLMRRAI